VQRQGIAPPGHILPAAEVGQQVGSACLLGQGEIIEPEFLEAAMKPSMVLQLARNQETPRARGETGELDITLLGIVGTG